MQRADSLGKKKNNAGETEGKGEETDRGGGGWMA